MIHNVRSTGRQLKVRPSERLRTHFLSLARRVVSWKQASGLSDGPGVSIGVTSVEIKGGCSVVAVNLAAALAGLGQGNVLYIETGNSTGGFSRKVPRPGYGFSEMLSARQDPSECICNTNVDNLFVMSCGRVRNDVALDLPIDALASINPELGNTFDFIIFDLPVANEMTLCFPMMEHLDGIIIVNSPNIHENRIQRVIKRVRESHKPVIGLVVNKA